MHYKLLDATSRRSLSPLRLQRQIMRSWECTNKQSNHRLLSDIGYDGLYPMVSWNTNILYIYTSLIVTHIYSITGILQIFLQTSSLRQHFPAHGRHCCSCYVAATALTHTKPPPSSARGSFLSVVAYPRGNPSTDIPAWLHTAHGVKLRRKKTSENPRGFLPWCEIPHIWCENPRGFSHWCKRPRGLSHQC